MEHKVLEYGFVERPRQYPSQLMRENSYILWQDRIGVQLKRDKERIENSRFSNNLLFACFRGVHRNSLEGNQLFPLLQFAVFVEPSFCWIQRGNVSYSKRRSLLRQRLWNLHKNLCSAALHGWVGTDWVLHIKLKQTGFMQSSHLTVLWELLSWKERCFSVELSVRKLLYLIAWTEHYWIIYYA